MEPKPQDQPGYYVWAPPGKDLAVHIRLDVLDNLLAEIMRGFGAVPKRGAEVGGVLIGAIERGDQTIVRVEDFEPVECGYTRGPSFLLSEEEQKDFADACQRWQPDAGRESYAVGCYRSHTRDGMSLATEDSELLDKYFAGPSHIALLVKPLITKASPAGFFFREDGVFQEATLLEFPFRRRELTGEDPPAHRPLTDRKRAERPRALPPRGQSDADLEFGEPAQPGHAYATLTPTQSKLKRWMWIPLSFVFLLVGVALGFQAALSMNARSAAVAIPDLSLALTVSKNDQDLTVKWNRESPAIRAAQRGVLEIQDGAFAKPVDLDAVHLQTGSIIYHNTSDSVQFRLIVYVTSRLTVTETLDWKQ